MRIYTSKQLKLTRRLLELFAAFWGKVWASVAKVCDPMMRVQEPESRV